MSESSQEKPVAGKVRALLRKARPVRTGGILAIWGPGLLLVIAGFLITWSYIEPAPPSRVVLATGGPTGAYARFGAAFAPTFERDGIELVVEHTGGTVDNFGRLARGEAMAAIVQGGVALPEGIEPVELQGIAALYYEPIFVFHRGEGPAFRLDAIAGQKIAVGGAGSGTRAVAEQLLDMAGISQTIERLPLGPADAAKALIEGTIDAAFIVTSPDAAVIAELLAAPGVQLMRFKRATAYARRMAPLSPVVLGRGVVDLARDLPSEDVPLLAATAALVARSDLHDALPPLFVEAVRDVHGNGSLLAPPEAFPALQPIDFPVEASTRLAFESGRSFLYRVLPFWAASMVDRLKILLLPLLTLLIPLIRIAPPMYRWRIRSRIYRWYRVVRALDARIGEAAPDDPLTEEREMVAQMEDELRAIDVPLSYMEEFYHLRLHADLVRRQLEAHDAKADT